MTDLNHKCENKIRVAGYIGVKHKMDYDHQVEDFTHQIRRNPEYQLVEMFTDIGYYEPDAEGLTGLIQACEEGKIDKVIVKDMNLFIPGPNEMCQFFRKLKELGVELYFHEQRFDAKNELIMIIVKAFAEEEQRKKIS